MCDAALVPIGEARGWFKIPSAGQQVVEFVYPEFVWVVLTNYCADFTDAILDSVYITEDLANEYVSKRESQFPGYFWEAEKMPLIRSREQIPK